MRPPRGTVTVVFTDIVGSTALRDRLVAEHGEERGDQRYREEILDLHNGRIRPLLERHHGFEIKTNGDSFMAAFQSARDAVLCSAEIQRAFRDDPVVTEAGRLRVRIGMHTGRPTPFRNEAGGWDYDGHTVNIAARVEGLIEGGNQVLCSAATHAAAHDVDTIRYHTCGFYALRGVHEAVEVFDILWDDAQQASPPERRIGKLEAELYEWLTPWVGRRAQMAELAAAIRANKLVTLHGVGGVGKTRLTIETIIERRGELPRNIVFVPLATRLDDRDDFVAAIRDALRMDESDAPDFAALRRSLARGDHLLILDNFETVMSAAGLIPLLAVLPNVRVVVTTQTVLDVTGEKVVSLQPMPLSGALEELESYRLFVELARRRSSDWTPDDADAMQTVLSCTDGLPYLIEIIAPFAASRPLQQLARELQQSVAKTRMRTADELRAARHHSLEACLRWAVGRLLLPDRRALLRLSAFVGGFDGDGARAVCAAEQETLDRLTAAALIHFDRNRARYTMLSTTREFLCDELGGLSGGLAVMLANYYAQRLVEADQALVAPGGDTQARARMWIAAEADNIRHVVTWAADADVSVLFTIIRALTNYFIQKSQYVEMLRLNLLVEERMDPQRSRNNWAVVQLNIAMALTHLPTGKRVANLHDAIGRIERTLPAIEADQPALWAQGQNSLGAAYMDLPVGSRRENLATAIRCYEKALRVWESQGNPWRIAMAHHNIGRAYAEMPTAERLATSSKAIEHYNAALRGWSRDDYPLYWAMTWNHLGEIYRLRQSGDPRDDLANAVRSYEAALSVYTEAEFPEQSTMVRHNMALAYAGLPMPSNLACALENYHAVLRVWTETDNPPRWALTQNNIGVVHYLNAMQWSPDDETRNANCRRAIEHFDAALRVRKEDISSADWAMTQCNLGNAFGAFRPVTAGNVERAVDHYEASLRVYTESEFPSEWARVQLNLGTLYGSQVNGSETNLHAALRCLESALRVWNPRDFALQAATVHERLAEIYGYVRHRPGLADKEIEEWEEAARLFRATRFGMKATNASLAARLLRTKKSRSIPARIVMWAVRRWMRLDI